MVARFLFIIGLFGILLFSSNLLAADPLPVVLTGVEHQPLAAQAGRVASALELLGTPLGKEQAEKLKQATQSKDHDRSYQTDPGCSRSALPRRREHQPREPRESGRGPADEASSWSTAGACSS